MTLPEIEPATTRTRFRGGGGVGSCSSASSLINTGDIQDFRV